MFEKLKKILHTPTPEPADKILWNIETLSKDEIKKKFSFSYVWDWKNWLCEFERTSGKCWWIKNDWSILAEGFDDVSSFSEWAASFQKDWQRWTISSVFRNGFALFSLKNEWGEGWFNTNGNVLWWLYKRCFNFWEDFDGLASFVRKDGRSTWYIDTKWREWDDVEDRDWTIYLQRWWKWYLKSLIKNSSNNKY